ncbi:uncharacterized protein [Rutidosis leptorrhynchoides]|uniref:uncharacterized protein n=1 Tax=Rutidosis leptorrhynchoides TaxID=125765 RepID=UPI003A991B3E
MKLSNPRTSNRSPRHEMVPSNAAWPFSKWAIDIVGSFLKEAGNVNFLVVAIDFFTKWVKAKPLNTLPTKKKFKFRVGRHSWGRVEKDGWMSYRVSYGHIQRQQKDNTKETPFSLVYGSEAVIPAETSMPTFRVVAYSEEANENAIRENLNLLEERRILAFVRQAENKQKIAKYYNK